MKQGHRRSKKTHRLCQDVSRMSYDTIQLSVYRNTHIQDWKAVVTRYIEMYYNTLTTRDYSNIAEIRILHYN